MNDHVEMDLIDETSDIVSAYLSHNPMQPANIPELIAEVHRALHTAAKNAAPKPPAENLVPAVPVKKSITPEHIICLEDGKKFKSLKRHLSRHYGLTPEQYREKWGLPKDYPMVSANYAAARSKFALDMGLGKRKA